MATATPSTERTVLIAVAGTLLSFAVMLVIPAFHRPALMAFGPFLLVSIWSTSAVVPRAISDPLAEAAVWLEFAIHRSSYDDLVARTPTGAAPRLIRVSRHEVDDWNPHYEEIWFDEADALGSADSSIRRARFDASHPRHPDQRRHSTYLIRGLGGHYYFIDVRNWMPD